MQFSQIFSQMQSHRFFFSNIAKYLNASTNHSWYIHICPAVVFPCNDFSVRYLAVRSQSESERSTRVVVVMSVEVRQERYVLNLYRE